MKTDSILEQLLAIWAMLFILLQAIILMSLKDSEISFLIFSLAIMGIMLNSFGAACLQSRVLCQK